MKLIQYNNDCFTTENIFQDGTSVIVILDNEFSQNENFVETWFADCDNVHPTNYGFYIDDCTFEEVEMGRRADHVEWEEEVNINYLLSLGFTIEEIEEGVMDHQILEVEREQGMRPWEEEDY